MRATRIFRVCPLRVYAHFALSFNTSLTLTKTWPPHDARARCCLSTGFHSDAMKRIDEQQVKITEFEKKTNNSCIIGQIGEENLRQVLEGLKHHW